MDGFGNLKPSARLLRLEWAEQLAIDFLKEHPDNEHVRNAARDLRARIVAIKDLIAETRAVAEPIKFPIGGPNG